MRHISRMYSYLTPLVIFFLMLCDGNESSCDFEPCLDTYNSVKGLYETYSQQEIAALPGVINTICSQQNELEYCTRKQSKNCRGDLNYHFFVRLVERLSHNQNCSGMGTNSSGGSTTATGRGRSTGSPGSTASTRGNSPRHLTRPRHAKCSPRASVTDPTVGCALFGLTNLKSFSDPLNFTDVPYCSLSGAWSLIDTPDLAVQITNKGGLSPMPKDITTTTLVTVIIKNNECSERKTYQATFDEVPAMFSDGSTTAGNVYIEDLVRSEHVRIHFPYILTSVDIIKVIGHLPIPTLSVTIKMPQANASVLSTDLSRSNKGLPLCFYGCPRTASMKPRSVDPAHRCPPSGSETSSTEFLDTANSITSAICDSLSNVQNILRESSVLEHRLRLPGDENFVTQSDSSSHAAAHNPRFPSAAENSALTSQSVGQPYNTYRSLLVSFSILLIFSYR